MATVRHLAQPARPAEPLLASSLLSSSALASLFDNIGSEAATPSTSQVLKTNVPAIDNALGSLLQSGNVVALSSETAPLLTAVARTLLVDCLFKDDASAVAVVDTTGNFDVVGLYRLLVSRVEREGGVEVEDVQGLAAKALDRVKIMREAMCWTDYLSLPFTQTVITETLRMGNIIIGVMRKAMKDIEIKGYLIPKGWCAFAYFRSVHLDENNYEWPYQFNPWRWQDKDLSNSSFTPFGGGQRLCPGLDLARLEASIFLHHFVTQFRWVAEEDTIVNFPTVRMKKRMPIWVQRRDEN